MTVKMPEIEKTSLGITTIRIPYKRNTLWEQWILLSADRHFDNPKSDQKMQVKHLKQAVERNAGIVDLGDCFCAMQGKYDPRGNKKDIRPENNVENYLDSLVDSGEDLFSPYAANWWLVRRGNHEGAILTRLETDLIGRLVKRLRAHGSGVVDGGFRGWVRLMFEDGNSGRQSIKLYTTHGGGGNAPVTKGIINSMRRAASFPDADIVCSGHIHEGWQFPITRSRVSDCGKEYRDEQLHISIPTYKDEFFGTESGWAHTKEFPPKPLGAWWLRFYWSGTRIEFTAERAR